MGAFSLLSPDLLAKGTQILIPLADHKKDHSKKLGQKSHTFSNCLLLLSPILADHLEETPHLSLLSLIHPLSVQSMTMLAMDK